MVVRGVLRSYAMRHFVVTWLVIAGCSSNGPHLVGAQPSWRAATQPAQPVARPITLPPTLKGAVRYNESPPAVPRTPLEEAMGAAIAEAAKSAGLKVPSWDARLSQACAELAGILSEQDTIKYALTEFALQRNGIIEPSPRLFLSWGDVESHDAIVKQLQPRLSELVRENPSARFGIGAAKRKADGTGAAVFALQDSKVSTLPIPRAVPPGATILLDAVVDPQYREPEVFVTHSDGRIEQMKLDPGRPDGFIARIGCGPGSGKQQIEITARDARGPTVLANFPVWCGEEPPSSVTVEGVAEVPAKSTEQVERILLENINRDRTHAALPALVWDERLAAVARAHSEEMWKTRIVAHTSPTTGSATDRVRAAKIVSGAVLENLARSFGVNEAHEELMNSPGHRANLMSRLVTRIGIGVAFGEEISGQHELFITEVFTYIPAKIDPASAVELVRRKLAIARRTMVNTPQLRLLAQQLAEAVAAGKSIEAAHDTMRTKLEGVDRRYQRVDNVVATAADLDGFDPAGVVGDAPWDEAGIGIAQGPHPDFGDSAIWIVILLANRR